MNQILICDDDPIFQLNVKRSLQGRFDFRSAYNGDEAIEILQKYPIDLILLDIKMRSSTEGLQFIPKFLRADPDLSIVMTSAMKDFFTVREAMRLGAADYVLKDADGDELAITLERSLERRRLIKRQHQQDFEVLAGQRQYVLIGESPPIQALRKSIQKIQGSPASVVISGETGTGKELVARQLRKVLSNQPPGTGSLASVSLAPFVAVDSATIQSSTAESILFGHEKGAFTGADKITKGIFEEAHGGIVYFDEISNMPLSIQAKLLRVLQEKEICRLGSSKTIQLDFRVICATNRDLEKMIQAGEFKEDLFQRLNVIPIRLPPLRERTEDIPILIEHFIRKHTSTRPTLKFSDTALAALQSYPWPGNVRELSNLVAYLDTMAEGSVVNPSDLPEKFREKGAKLKVEGKSAESTDSNPESTSYYDRVLEFEKRFLSQEYAKHQGNISRLASALGMDRSHLYTKLRQFKIHSK